MKNFDFKQAEEKLLYKVIAGSKAYGLDLPDSDTDIRGIFLQPNQYKLVDCYREQVSDSTNDIIYYELNRFVHLLAGNNPNIIENLFVPEDCILHLDDRILPLYNNRNRFLSKKIRHTFGGYAISQIKKVRGLNKKINNPITKTKRTPLDFCHVYSLKNRYMITAREWLRKRNLKQKDVGLTKMPSGRQLYNVYIKGAWKEENFRGITRRRSNELVLSEIPKEYENPNAFLYYDLDGYSTYCKQYKEYWDWVAKRNPKRYADNISHSQNYDGKNMMHCLRMLDMAIEVAQGKGVNLIRPNREWLLSVRRGEVSYEEIMALIEEKRVKMDEAFEHSKLPDDVDDFLVHDIILTIRMGLERHFF